MKRACNILVCLVVLVTSVAFTRRDDIIDTLSNKLQIYQLEHPATVLHLHLDKNIYNTNEDIWFKAYILNPEADSSKVLYVRLTDLNKKLILMDQFPITDIRSNGDMMIPDTLKDGDYYLYAYTDRMINYSAKNIFVQRITVKHNSAKKLYAEASVIDTTQLKRGHTVQVLVRVKNDHDLLKNIKGEYKLITDGLSSKVGKLSTNQFGEATFSFVYPNLPNNQSLNVKINFKDNSGFADLILNLKHEGNPIRVSLYPEGGHFIAGVPVKTVVQATDIKNNPVTAKVLFKNGLQVIAGLQLDKNGRGTFNFTPTPNASYIIDAEMNGNKTISPFEGIIENKGYGLKILDQKNILKITLKNIGEKEHATLVLRSLEDVLWSQPLTVPSGDSAVLSIPVSHYPKQVLNIGAFDDAGNLLSERLFLNRQNENYKVDIKTEEQFYGPRKKVTVHVNITDAFGQPVIANLSVAAAEKDRIDAADYRDILNTWYLRFLDGENYFNSLSDPNPDGLMITKNWRQSRWEDVLKYTARGKIMRLKNSDGVVGFLTPLVKKPKKISQLVVISGNGILPLTVSQNNYFSINSADLIRDRSVKAYLIMNEDMVDDYEINILNYSKDFDDQINLGGALFIPEVFNNLARYEEAKQAFNKGVIQLKEVKIKGNSSTEDQLNGVPIYKSTNCNDMVCMYNILNCKNHPGCCSPPVDGAVYSLNGRAVIYKGCGSIESKTHIPLKCVSIPKQFYLPDYDKSPSPEPEYHSTVYWNPNMNTDKQGNLTFSFYTSDVTGDFTITAQGVDVYKILPLSGTGKFSVK